MLMSVKDLATHLGIKASTLYSWSERGLIPHYKIHGLLRFKKEEVDAWIDSFGRSAQPATSVTMPRNKRNDLDIIIATAKREAYNTLHGKPGQDQSRGRRPNGTV